MISTQRVPPLLTSSSSDPHASSTDHMGSFTRWCATMCVCVSNKWVEQEFHQATMSVGCTCNKLFLGIRALPGWLTTSSGSKGWLITSSHASSPGGGFECPSQTVPQQQTKKAHLRGFRKAPANFKSVGGRAYIRHGRSYTGRASQVKAGSDR